MIFAAIKRVIDGYINILHKSKNIPLKKIRKKEKVNTQSENAKKKRGVLGKKKRNGFILR